MKTALVHVGAHKAGSTTIQATLFKSRNGLDDKGIYSFVGLGEQHQLLSMKFRADQRKYNIIKKSLSSLDEIRKASEIHWKKLADEVRYRQPHLTVISEEALLRVPDIASLHEHLYNIFDRVLILVYVREPVTRLPSSIGQRIIAGKTFENLISLNSLVPRMLPNINRYRLFFGASNIIVRNFDTQNFVERSLIQDISYVISNIVDEKISLLDVPIKNQSLSANNLTQLLKENERTFKNGFVKTPEWVSRRKKNVKKMQVDRTLLGGTKLKLSDSDIRSHLWSKWTVEASLLNEHYLKNQIQIAVPSEKEPLPKNLLNYKMSKWLFENK